MEMYLTKKARPGKGALLMEKTALLALTGLFALCIGLLVSALMLAYQAGILSWRNFLPLIPAVLLALVMNPLVERIRARHHAKVIVRALLAADGQIAADEAEAAIGLSHAADTALRLVAQGYLRDIVLAQGVLCVKEVADRMAPEKEVAPLFRDVEA